jgi:hypothetical protein
MAEQLSIRRKSTFGRRSSAITADGIDMIEIFVGRVPDDTTFF